MPRRAWWPDGRSGAGGVPEVLASAMVLLIAVLGPGFITANVDNDAGGIFTLLCGGPRGTGTRCFGR